MQIKYLMVLICLGELLFGLTCAKKTDGIDDLLENNVSLTGTWDTEYGTMFLIQVNDSVWGRYEFRRGQIAGKLHGDSLIAQWWEGADKAGPYDSAHIEFRGPARFLVLHQGDSLCGNWRCEENVAWSETIWWASRTSLAIDSNAVVWTDNSMGSIGDTTMPLKSSLSGTWESDEGTMVVVQQQDSVKIWYGEPFGYIAGILSGRVIHGQWWESDDRGVSYATSVLKGNVRFVVNDNEDSLFGQWRMASDTEWADVRWNAEKVSTSTDTTALWSTDSSPTVYSFSPGLYKNSDSTSELLFVAAGEDSLICFYFGTRDAGGYYPSYVIIQTAEKTRIAIIFHNFLPVQWISDSVTIAAYNLSETTGMDFHAAFHWLRGHREGDTASMVLDLLPVSIESVLDSLETRTSTDLLAVRQYFADSLLTTMNQLAARAAIPGPSQAQAIDDACALGVAAAVVAMGGYVPSLAKRQILSPQAFKFLIDPFVKVGVSWVSHLMTDDLRDNLLAGGGPTYRAALCEGASSWDICHYLIYPMCRYGDCIQYCLTTLGCFVNICMPIELSVDEAKKFIDRKIGYGTPENRGK